MPRTVGVQPSAYNVKVTLSGGTSSVTTFVRLFNRRTREFVDVKAVSNNAVINAADCSSDGSRTGTFSGWTDGDVFEVRCFGGRYGSGTHTINQGTSKVGGSVTVTVDNVSSTTNPAVSV